MQNSAFINRNDEDEKISVPGTSLSIQERYLANIDGKYGEHEDAEMYFLPSKVVMDIVRSFCTFSPTKLQHNAVDVAQDFIKVSAS